MWTFYFLFSYLIKVQTEVIVSDFCRILIIFEREYVLERNENESVAYFGVTFTLHNIIIIIIIYCLFESKMTLPVSVISMWRTVYHFPKLTEQKYNWTKLSIAYQIDNFYVCFPQLSCVSLAATY